MVLAIGFALVITPTLGVETWMVQFGKLEVGPTVRSAITVRVPPFAGHHVAGSHIEGGGILVARGEIFGRDRAAATVELHATTPHGIAPYLAYFLLCASLVAVYSHHLRRSIRGRLLRVQVVHLGILAAVAAVTKLVLLTTSVSVLAVPVAIAAIVPTLVFDRIVGLATGVLTAIIVSLLVPFDVGIAMVLLAQAATAGLLVPEAPKRRLRAAILAGMASAGVAAFIYGVFTFLTTGVLPLAELATPTASAWVAATLGGAIAAVVSSPLLALYQRMVGEITSNHLIQLQDLSNPLLRQIAEKSPGTWQHSLAMANMAEVAANATGADGRLVRVGAYYHDLGKSLQAKYFIENIEPGEVSPHEQLPPEVSCDAIFAHVTEGIVAARRAKLHERIIDFMHMHHGNGVLEYFWAKCQRQGNPKQLSVESFRYPGLPPQSRETAILAICDAVEAAARTLKGPDAAAIDHLVQRIVYGKLHLGQLDESGLSMADLRRISDSLRETIRHAHHGRIEYPWQEASSAAGRTDSSVRFEPRLDSLDSPRPPWHAQPSVSTPAEALATTAMSVAVRPVTPAQPARVGAATATGVVAPATGPTATSGRSGQLSGSDESVVSIEKEYSASSAIIEIVEADGQRAHVAAISEPVDPDKPDVPGVPDVPDKEPSRWSHPVAASDVAARVTRRGLGPPPAPGGRGSTPVEFNRQSYQDPETTSAQQRARDSLADQFADPSIAGRSLPAADLSPSASLSRRIDASLALLDREDEVSGNDTGDDPSVQRARARTGSVRSISAHSSMSNPATEPTNAADTTPSMPVSPADAELTSQQPLAEIERLAARTMPSQPLIRRDFVTREIDPDDIEADIEVAPPTRRDRTGSHPRTSGPRGPTKPGKTG